VKLKKMGTIPSWLQEKVVGSNDKWVCFSIGPLRKF